MSDLCKKMCKNSGPLTERLALGLPFIVHGWMKLGNMAGTVGFFKTLGVPAPLAYAVALIEFLGGIAVALGMGTRFVAPLLAVIMLFAIVLTGAGKGAFGGHELEFVLFLLALGLSLKACHGAACACEAGCCEKHEKKDCTHGVCAMHSK